MGMSGWVAIEVSDTRTRPDVVFVELGEVVIVPTFALVVAGGDAEGTGAVKRRILSRPQGHAVNIALERVGAQIG